MQRVLRQRLGPAFISQRSGAGGQKVRLYSHYLPKSSSVNTVIIYCERYGRIVPKYTQIVTITNFVIVLNWIMVSASFFRCSLKHLIEISSILRADCFFAACVY